MTFPLSHEYLRLGRSRTECVLWAIHRADTTVKRFTSHSSIVPFREPDEAATQNYTPLGSITEQAIVSESGLRHKNTDLVGVLASSGITAAEFAQGRYDHAEVHRYVVDWMTPFLGAALFDVFFFGETSQDRDAWDVEVRGLTSLLTQKVGFKHVSTCPYTWADDMSGTDLEGTAADERMCKLIARDHRRPGAQVSAVTSQTTFRVNGIPNPVGSVTERTLADGHFNQGRGQWTSGLNTGLWFDIKTYVHGTIELVLQQPMPGAIAVNDQFDLWAGCGKRMFGVTGGAQGCVDFGNSAEFGGVFVPGSDELRQLPNRFGA